MRFSKKACEEDQDGRSATTAGTKTGKVGPRQQANRARHVAEQGTPAIEPLLHSSMRLPFTQRDFLQCSFARDEVLVCLFKGLFVCLRALSITGLPGCDLFFYKQAKALFVFEVLDFDGSVNTHLCFNF